MSERLTGFRHAGLYFDVVDEGPLDGPVLIALHGFPQLSTSWRDVTPHLTAAGFRVLAPDQRGYSPGARPTAVAAYRLPELAGDVIALADAAGVQRFHVLGHDWGGAVAWYLASRHADRVATVSVASTPHPRALLEALRGSQALRSWYILLFQLPKLPEMALRARGGALTRRMLRGSGLSADRTAESIALLREPGAATGAVNWYRAMRGKARGAGKVSVPALYVWSDKDKPLGRAAAEKTAKWVTGPYTFEVLTGVSHWIPEERPADLARLALDHIAAHQVD